jgi:hypothetical protein
MKTFKDIMKEAEEIHFELCNVEGDLDVNETDELLDKHFDLTFKIANLMREYLVVQFEEGRRASKDYFHIPGVKDFYSTNVGTVELDAEIAEAITLLNKKGYKTIASCAGHEEGKHGYIWLDPIPKESLPKGLHLDSGVIRWRPRSSKGLARCQKIVLNYAKSINYLNKV